MLNFCIDFEKRMLRQGRSEFGRRVEHERSKGGGARRSIAVPNGEGMAAGGQHKSIAFFNRA